MSTAYVLPQRRTVSLDDSSYIPVSWVFVFKEEFVANFLRCPKLSLLSCRKQVCSSTTRYVLVHHKLVAKPPSSLLQWDVLTFAPSVFSMGQNRKDARPQEAKYLMYSFFFYIQEDIPFFSSILPPRWSISMLTNFATSEGLLRFFVESINWK